jgi:hypothetical protein
MTSEQHHRQYQLCSRFGLGFALVSIVAHGIERYFKADLDLGYTFLWIAVLMLAQGCLQHLKSLRPNSPQAPNNALQRTEAGGGVSSYPTPDFASLRR